MILRGDETMDVDVAKRAMRTHLFRPVVDGRFPGVPEVYHEYEAPGTVLSYDAVGTARGNALKTEKPVAAYDADARAALTALAAHPACDGRLATFGVCLGDHLAYRAALDPRVIAAACFYATDIHAGTLGEGRCDDSIARMAELRAETMLVWRRHDPHVPFVGRELIHRRLEEVGANYKWHEVAAQHAFLCDEGPSFDPALFLQAMAWVLALYQRAFMRSVGRLAPSRSREPW